MLPKGLSSRKVFTDVYFQEMATTSACLLCSHWFKDQNTEITMEKILKDSCLLSQDYLMNWRTCKNNHWLKFESSTLLLKRNIANNCTTMQPAMNNGRDKTKMWKAVGTLIRSNIQLQVSIQHMYIKKSSALHPEHIIPICVGSRVVLYECFSAAVAGSWWALIGKWMKLNTERKKNSLKRQKSWNSYQIWV